ncbi:MAG: deaminase, partial [Candidatus Micrarchaeota archaeon]
IRLSTELRRVNGLTEAMKRRGNLRFEDDRIEYLQCAGDEFCETLKIPFAVTLLGIRKLRKIRQGLTGDALRPSPRTVYIFHSLKRPQEVKLLKMLYGPRCIFLGAYSPREQRVTQLTEQIAVTRSTTDSHLFRHRAEALITTDESEGPSFGQSVQEAFPFADAFINTDDVAALPDQIARFLGLLFGNPIQSPTKDEFGMFLAKAAALRSADLSRQVGAVIMSQEGDVIAVGSNEVPKPLGGLYWIEDTEDDRDCRRGADSARSMRKTTAEEILAILHDRGLLALPDGVSNVEELATNLWPLLKSTRLGGIGEFGRSVHAEMAALIDAAKRGVSVHRATLFVTTFPCHNCTRHLIAAGIQRVVYIEPYPKSLAERLHQKAIVVDSPNWVEGRVNFQPFVGISPHRYVSFFQYAKDERRNKLERSGIEEATPRYLEGWQSPVYQPIEEQWLDMFERLLKERGLVLED